MVADGGIDAAAGGKKRKKYAALAALAILVVAQIHRLQQAGLSSSYLLQDHLPRYFVYVVGTSGLCSQIMNSMAQAGKMAACVCVTITNEQP